jgi:hypothetical protein
MRGKWHPGGSGHRPAPSPGGRRGGCAILCACASPGFSLLSRADLLVSLARLPLVTEGHFVWRPGI